MTVLIIAIVIAGALLGGNSLGSIIRNGCGCLFAIAVCLVIASLFFFAAH
jgi:hypothetical protein